MRADQSFTGVFTIKVVSKSHKLGGSCSLIHNTRGSMMQTAHDPTYSNLLGPDPSIFLSLVQMEDPCESTEASAQHIRKNTLPK